MDISPHKDSFITMASKTAAFYCLLALVNAEPRVTNWMPSLDPSIEPEPLEPLGPEYSNRVIGGEDADIAEFPHQVSLQYSSASGGQLSHFCGGTVIDREWILTAGHCAKAIPASGIIVVKAGKRNIRIKEKFEQVVKVEKIYIHKLYKGGVGPYDIALLKLKYPLNYTLFVRKIKLPPAGQEPTGIVVLSGWGSISKSAFGVVPRILQKVTLPIVDRQTCDAVIKDKLGRSMVHKTNICTGPLEGGLGACRGDSGGPLIAVGPDGEYEVVGVVSWGFVPCGGTDAPSVFVKVSDFIDWIKKVMDEDASTKTVYIL